jgi:hypothetical protein
MAKKIPSHNLILAETAAQIATVLMITVAAPPP